MRKGDNGAATDEAAAAAAEMGVAVFAGTGAGLSVLVGAAAGVGANSGQVNTENEFVCRIRSKGSDGDGDAVVGDYFLTTMILMMANRTPRKVGSIMCASRVYASFLVKGMDVDAYVIIDPHVLMLTC